MNKGNILLIDNDALFLDTRAIFLEKAGYRVFKAYSLEMADTILTNHWILMIVIDVRAQDDDDIYDKSGIEFAKRAEYLRIPKVILTGRPTSQDTRNVLVPSPELDGRPIAVDYIDKGEGGRA